MSECTLHVLDAPRIKTPQAAADFVAKWVDQDGKRNARLDTFLCELLDVFPEASGTEDSIWYESPVPVASTSPVLPLYFKLALFDTSVLQTLRTIAGKHKLHVFDEEGHVLYLANGTEVSKSSVDPFEALKSATHSPHGLRYDGVYAAKMPVGWSYYRFAADGKVYRLALAKQATATVAFRQMVEGDPFVGYGKYVVDKDGIAGKVKQANGVFYITAQLKGSTLSVTSVRKDGAYRYSAMYEFSGVC